MKEAKMRELQTTHGYNQDMGSTHYMLDEYIEPLIPQVQHTFSGVCGVLGLEVSVRKRSENE